MLLVSWLASEEKMCHPDQQKKLFCPLIYTIVYVPIIEMRKYRSRIFLLFLKKVCHLKSNHNTPSYEVYRKNESKNRTIRQSSVP